MRILVIGASGTIGKPLCVELEKRHKVIRGGRSGSDVSVDIEAADSIESMYKQVGPLDACICVASSGALDRFDELTEAALLANMRGKLFGQINLVLIGQRYLADGGSFTLTSGIFADEAWKGVTGGAIISGALHSFVLSAAIELPRALRINVVSPTMVRRFGRRLRSSFPRNGTGPDEPPHRGLCQLHGRFADRRNRQNLSVKPRLPGRDPKKQKKPAGRTCGL